MGMSLSVQLICRVSKVIYTSMLLYCTVFSINVADHREGKLLLLYILCVENSEDEVKLEARVM